MHVAGDLGFSSLVLFLSVVFPVIGFVIRRKWRASASRKEEIDRLLILAAEEAARAELEATFSYGAVSLPSSVYQCAVCCCPTTTRCSRCKAVRYCSGKCQIIHWRQGHKEECQPPINPNHNDLNRHNSAQKVATENRCGNASFGETFGEPSLSNSSSTCQVTDVSGDGCEADYDTVYGGTSASESPGTSFSGFSTSPSSDESSDSVSVGESVSSIDSKGSDEQISIEGIQDILEPELNMIEHTIPISPKFASLVESISHINKSSESKGSKIVSSNGEHEHPPDVSSGQSISLAHDGLITRPGKVSLGFWDRTLDSVVTCDSVQNESGLTDSSGVGDCKLSNSELFGKFDLTRNNFPLSNTQGSEMKGTQYDGSAAATSGISRPVDRAASSVTNGDGYIPTTNNFTSARCVKSTQDSDASKPSDLKSVSSSSCVYTPSSDKSDEYKPTSLKSNRSDSTDTTSTSHLSKSSVSSNSPQKHAGSSVNEHVVPSAKYGKVENIQTDIFNSSRVANSSANSFSGWKSSVRKAVDQLRGPKSGKYGDKGLFSYDLFVKLYTSNKVEMQPCGLINCGNSCYANAVLQCLAFTPPLTAYFFQGLHSKECVNKEWCFTCEFEDLILKAKEGNTPLSPVRILSHLQKVGSHLGNGREEDAHEFLRYAIGTMQSVCLKEAGVNNALDSLAGVNNALDSLEEETSLVGLTFGGYLQSKIQCMKCHFKSERHERMMDLTVEIEGNIEKLEDALKKFTSTEILDDDNRYQCSRCKSYVKAKKKLTILEAPNVLTIALKRFQSGKFGKLNKSIQYPEILNLAPYMSGTSDKSPIYRLFGVVVHLDIMNASFSGHYVCYVKNIQNKWFKIDDSLVTPVELDTVLAKGAYMLLYSRCSPRAPRLIRSRIASLDPKLKVGPSRINSAFSPRSTSSYKNKPKVNPPESIDSFYTRFQHLQRILEEDLSSDSVSFTSSNSEEGSCSTESTRDSTSTEDLSEYIFGGLNYSWRNSLDSGTCSSSSSPLYSAHSMAEDNEVEMQTKRDDRFLQSETTNEQRRKLESCSSCRETDRRKLGWRNSVKPGVFFRRSVSGRTG